MSTKTLVYLSFAAFPSHFAHSVQIMKMVEALGKTGDVQPILSADFKQPIEQLFSDYNISHPFAIYTNRVPSIRIAGRMISVFRSFFFLLKKKPQLIYTRDIFHCLLGCLVSLFFKTNIIYEIHETWHSIWKHLFFKMCLPCGSLKRLVFIAASLKEWCEKKYPKTPKIMESMVCHDGVDIADFEIQLSKNELRKTLSLPETAFVALYTGSLYQEKGIELIIDIARQCPGIHFAMVGGNYMQIQDYSKKAGLLNINNICFYGHRPFREMAMWLNAADVLLMPYQPARHGAGDITTESMSPLKMFEYMAARRPILASNLAEIREVLSEGKEALLLDPLDSGEWVTAIHRLKQEPSLGEALSENAFCKINGYSWLNRAKRIVGDL
jgi:glycosyltransferase involved in cell wall biosynthesis